MYMDLEILLRDVKKAQSSTLEGDEQNSEILWSLHRFLSKNSSLDDVIDKVVVTLLDDAIPVDSESSLDFRSFDLSKDVV